MLLRMSNIGYLLVIAANAEGESSVYASVRVIDFVKDSSFMALYFLNSGNMGNNNSSLYMYDIEKDEVVLIISWLKMAGGWEIRHRI